MDRYVITRRLLDPEIPQIEIREEEFNQIKRARGCLLNALAVEDKIGYVIENYRELELELLREALDNMLFSPFDWHGGIDKLHHISRRIVNLLSTTKAYLDHTEHHLSQLFGNPSSQLKELRIHKSQIYDSSLAYRTIEALRNFVQHRQLPIGAIKVNSQWVTLEGSEYRMHAISPRMLITDIDDEKFKRKILELAALKKKEIELKPLVDEYLEKLLEIHESTRQMLNGVTTEASKLVANSILRFRSADGIDRNHVDVIRLQHDGTNWVLMEVFPLIEEWIERLSQLEQRVRPSMRFTEQFATSLGKGRE